MLEVHTWEPDANWRKPLFHLRAKRVPVQQTTATWARTSNGEAAVCARDALFAAGGLALPGAVEPWPGRVAGECRSKESSRMSFPSRWRGPSRAA